jgi:hypothetical protein
MDNTKLISQECSVVAFYGIDPSAKSAAAFYHTVIEWFKSLGCPPDKAGIRGPGHSGKLGSFSRADAKLKKAGFEGVKSMEVLCSTPQALTGNDYFLTADWSVEYSYALVAARSSLATLSPPSMLPVTQTLAQVLKPEYGIGYTRLHRHGPAMYAIGICQGLGLGGYGVDLNDAEREDADSISRWGDAMAVQVWQKGILRDVYPWNFLTSSHLTKQIAGVPLEQWVRQDARRGTLSPLGDGVSLWEVTEANISDVRRLLRQSGIIFDWKKHL